jgi:6-phosphogluconolactonase
VQVHVAPDAAQAAELAADALVRRIRSAIARRGAATVAVSGGSTPRLMLSAVATAELPWHLVTCFQVDERVAPDGDPDRNVTLLRPLESIGAQVVPMPVAAIDLDEAARKYDAALPAQLDIVHLGMGDDGHTASWPPGDAVVDATTAVALSGEYRGRVRMTLTPRAVNAARFRLVLVTGRAKAEPLARWLAGDRALPIGRVHRSRTLVVADAEAIPPRPSDQPGAR